MAIGAFPGWTRSTDLFVQRDLAPLRRAHHAREALRVGRLRGAAQQRTEVVGGDGLLLEMGGKWLGNGWEMVGDVWYYSIDMIYT